MINVIAAMRLLAPPKCQESIGVKDATAVFRIRSSDMRKGKSRTRIARRDILKGLARSRTRVRDLQKQSYPKQDYDGHSDSEDEED